ncbi:hypothetical protein WN48_00765 [Eufriesea mexicana]|nr:hypothetical protein WN48_00765 [Eufriesea mexicana]
MDQPGAAEHVPEPGRGGGGYSVIDEGNERVQRQRGGRRNRKKARSSKTRNTRATRGNEKRALGNGQCHVVCGLSGTWLCRLNAFQSDAGSVRTSWRNLSEVTVTADRIGRPSVRAALTRGVKRGRHCNPRCVGIGNAINLPGILSGGWKFSNWMTNESEVGSRAKETNANGWLAGSTDLLIKLATGRPGRIRMKGRANETGETPRKLLVSVHSSIPDWIIRNPQEPNETRDPRIQSDSPDIETYRDLFGPYLDLSLTRGSIDPNFLIDKHPEDLYHGIKNAEGQDTPGTVSHFLTWIQTIPVSPPIERFNVRAYHELVEEIPQSLWSYGDEEEPGIKRGRHLVAGCKLHGVRGSLEGRSVCAETFLRCRANDEALEASEWLECHFDRERFVLQVHGKVSDENVARATAPLLSLRNSPISREVKVTSAVTHTLAPEPVSSINLTCSPGVFPAKESSQKQSEGAHVVGLVILASSNSNPTKEVWPNNPLFLGRFRERYVPRNETFFLACFNRVNVSGKSECGMGSETGVDGYAPLAWRLQPARLRSRDGQRAAGCS